MAKTARSSGVILVIISAIVFSSAGIFTKGVETAAWGVIFWRGLAAAGFTFGYLTLRGALFREIAAFRMPTLVVTLMMSAGTAVFIPAFKLSTVANVALIYAAAPLIAAAMAWAFVGERPTRTVVIASLAAFCGVLVIVSGSLGITALLGDALALFMTVMMAGSMVIFRRYPETTAALPNALSSVVVLLAALVLGEPFAAPSAELPILIGFGLVFVVASVTLSEGARRLPSGETALLSTLEMPLAPILACVILAETPTGRVLIGGAIILVAALWSQRQPS